MNRRIHTKGFKFQVAVECIKGDLTLAQIMSKYKLSSSLVHKWKKQLLDNGSDIFDQSNSKSTNKEYIDVKQLHAKIGELLLENDFLEDALFRRTRERKTMINHTHKLSIRRQCEVLDINRSTLFYTVSDNIDDMSLVNHIAEIYSKYPIYGYRRIKGELLDIDISANHKRIYRLMRESGIQAIYAAPLTTKVDKAKYKYSYLLRDLAILHAHQVWQVDITYIRTIYGFMYLTALKVLCCFHTQLL